MLHCGEAILSISQLEVTLNYLITAHSQLLFFLLCVRVCGYRQRVSADRCSSHQHLCQNLSLPCHQFAAILQAVDTMSSEYNLWCCCCCGVSHYCDYYLNLTVYCSAAMQTTQALTLTEPRS